MIVTSFTIAHSITLIASALGHAPERFWFPPLVETWIAISILYMAFENIIGANLRRRWVHHLRLRSHPRLRVFVPSQTDASIRRLALHNVAARVQCRRRARPVAGASPDRPVAERTVPLRRLGAIGTIYLSALITHSAWHWMVERAEQLRQFSWPALDAALLASLMRLSMLGVLFAAIVWLAFRAQTAKRTSLTSWRVNRHCGSRAAL